MAFEFAQVVAELVKAVGFFGELEALKNNSVNVSGSPAAKAVASMEQNFKQPDDASLMDLDARVVDRADGDRQGDALQQREVHVDVQPLGLESGETIRDRQELIAYGVEMLEAFLQAKVAEEILSTVHCAGRCRTSRIA